MSAAIRAHTISPGCNSATHCALALACALAACGKPATHATRIYVSNENDGTVSVIEGRRVVATVPVGKRPRGLHVRGKYLYVALSGTPKGGPGVDESSLPPPDRAADGIGIVDLDQLKLVRTIASGADPESFDLLGDDQLVVSNEDTGEASLVAIGAGAVRGHVAVGGEPEGVATTPDGRLVFVTSEAGAHIAVLDPRAMRVVANIPTGLRPRGIAFSPDGGTAYVTNETEGSVSILDAHALAAVGRIQIPREGSTAVGPRPMGVTTIGRTVYVTTGRGGSVAVIDPDARKVVRVISDVGARPWGIAAGPDGLLYTANGSSNDVSIIDPREGRVVARIPAGGSPWGIAISR